MFNLEILEKRLYISLFNLKRSMTNNLGDILYLIKKRVEGCSEPFVKAMLKLTLIKAGLMLITLLAMTTLYVYIIHSNMLKPIALRLPIWGSYSLIGFISLILFVKFVGILGFLTAWLVKESIVKGILLKFSLLKTLRLPVFLRKKVQLQIN